MPLDKKVICRSLRGPAGERLAVLEVFTEIESTNTYLLQQPGPAAGRIRVAATDNQTAGRGRQGRTWQSPPGAGLCLSLAYTFASTPRQLPALTLAVGLGAIDALQELGVGALQLKWPNDLIAADCKLGGILTEAQTQSNGAVTVVTGIGLNVDLGKQADPAVENDRALRAIDLKRHAKTLPARNAIAASLISALSDVLVEFETSGAAEVVRRWRRYDWLFGKELTIDTSKGRISGIGAGIAGDGALLVDTRSSGRLRLTSGTVVSAAVRETTS